MFLLTFLCLTKLCGSQEFARRHVILLTSLLRVFLSLSNTDGFPARDLPFDHGPSQFVVQGISTLTRMGAWGSCGDSDVDFTKVLACRSMISAMVTALGYTRALCAWPIGSTPSQS